jgi:hypothetical protein
MKAEKLRLKESESSGAPWRKWGPYVSERQWGTVREDNSENGDAWHSFTHDQARSRAYRWGEDGIAGISDSNQLLCFAPAFWNGRDAILKERLFGLTNSEGNHGEDVKEYYFYLDNTPTHSYMKYLYRYPQAAFPYNELVEQNRLRSKLDLEYELLDTGVFDENRYFDVTIEYAKASPEEILVRLTVCNKGPEEASIHLLPTLWFRNNWSACIAKANRSSHKPQISQWGGSENGIGVVATHPLLGNYYLACDREVPFLFTDNESNNTLLFGTPNDSSYVKDGINNCVVNGQADAVNPQLQGTKVAAHIQLSVGAGMSSTVCLVLSQSAKVNGDEYFKEEFNAVMEERINEANEFYQSVIPQNISADNALVMRQALAGMLWSKQFFFFDGDNWLDDRGANPLHHGHKNSRNSEWYHLLNKDIISMPDKWEYPWYAAWDLAFHALPISIVDPYFAKQQMELMLGGLYLHPNGQIPAYEWNFSDVNPPVHAWATLFLYYTDRSLNQKGDIRFLKSIFNKLLLNFTWWVNRKDRLGKNVFEGGFLGLDNIGVFDRSAPLPTGGSLEQADGTAWMALYSQNMAEMAIELASFDPAYEDMVVKFAEHFYFIAAAMNKPGDDGMWDEDDGFYYDLLRLPDGTSKRLKVRSLVGLLPLCATTVIEKHQRDKIPNALSQINERLHRMPELRHSIHQTGEGNWGEAQRGIIALLNQERLRRILTVMLDENEFLGPYGIRSLSKYHEKHPYVVDVDGKEYRVDYQPAESTSDMFGGNSNWRGPVWMPINVLLIRALHQFYLYYGDSFKIECPTGSGNYMHLYDVATELAQRLVRIFTLDENGRRPVFGGCEKFQTDIEWRDKILFYEYFHGDNGAGLGASHQTGWTGTVAKLQQLMGQLNADQLLKQGIQAAFGEK